MEEGYQPPQLDRLQSRALRIMKGTATFEDRYFPDHEEAVLLINHLRSSGCIIAFVTGVWDLFHIGHAEYIQLGKNKTAELYPDAEHVICVVGFDSDELTRRRKGDGRPVVPEDERARVLGHLRAVDVIVPQYESDQLFCLIPHEVRIISESTSDLPDSSKMKRFCEHIVNLPPQAETSTTARVRTLTMQGGLDVLEKISPEVSKALETLEGVSDAIQKVIEETRDGS